VVDLTQEEFERHLSSSLGIEVRASDGSDLVRSRRLDAVAQIRLQAIVEELAGEAFPDALVDAIDCLEDWFHFTVVKSAHSLLADESSRAGPEE
jgi:hypothetical protein